MQRRYLIQRIPLRYYCPTELTLANQQSPLSFHKYAYAHQNPIHNLDPTGLFVGGLSQLTMTNAINAMLSQSMLSAIGTVFKAYNMVNRVIKFMDFARFAIDFAFTVSQAFMLPTPEGAASIIAKSIANYVKQWVDPGTYILGIKDMFSKVGSKWKDYANRIVAAAPRILSEALAKVGGEAIAASLNKDVAWLLYLPTTIIEERKGEKLIRLSRDYSVGVNIGGGRIFGLGLHITKKNQLQFFRIDYWHGGVGGKARLHYHIGGGTGNGKDI